MSPTAVSDINNQPLHSRNNTRLYWHSEICQQSGWANIYSNWAWTL